MLKIKLFILYFLFCTFILSMGQNKAVIEVNYETKLIKDSLNRNNVQLMEYTLLSNENESYYFNRDAKQYYDALFGKSKPDITNMVQTTMGSIPRYPRFTASVYKVNNIVNATLPVGRYNFTFPEPELKWEILNQTKNIKNYKCQLAKTKTENGDEFYAWFTNEIPIQDGPFRFKGLSGMVLEVYNKNKTIEIYATDIKKSTEQIDLIIYSNPISAKTKAEYLKARKAYYDDPSIYNGNIKVLDANGIDKTHKIIESLKRTNVFLD
ncbi:GLPGLI family protein [Elizabethkingia anophelis]|uniref:GLPGLI family protein n=1 Tax=Elizabethkingia anophelis TaxID=1117645 RepID=UPI003015E3F1|nr:GLPGLI family protein [Elizabethkingia meningoseptica]